MVSQTASHSHIEKLTPDELWRELKYVQRNITQILGSDSPRVTVSEWGDSRRALAMRE